MKVVHVAIWISIGFILSVVLKNLLIKNKKPEVERTEQLNTQFGEIVKTPEFSLLFQTKEFGNILDTRQFKNFAKLFGTQQLLNILTK